LIVKNSETPDLVKVVDFGIAKVIDPRGLEAQELTQTGDILGSPLYMSPEQCMGEELDARTDIYSLGCVMYQGITGKPPIIAENVVKTIFKHVNVVPDRISVARPDIHIPFALEQVIFKALEKKPVNRFSTMEELRAALLQARQSMG
jgi:serine/threonine-protein kinase